MNEEQTAAAVLARVMLFVRPMIRMLDIDPDDTAINVTNGKTGQAMARVTLAEVLKQAEPFEVKS